jgi:hypothetical protein
MVNLQEHSVQVADKVYDVTDTCASCMECLCTCGIAGQCEKGVGIIRCATSPAPRACAASAPMGWQVSVRMDRL